MSIRVTVVVAAYNVAEYIGRTLESLVRSLTDEFELIVVNDGSDDDTQSVIGRYVAETAFPAKQVDMAHGGVSLARNAGLALARGEYVTFVDGDDYVTPDYGRRLTAYLQAGKPDVICFSAALDARFDQAPPPSDLSGRISGEEAFLALHGTNTLRAKMTTCMFSREFLLSRGLIFTPGCSRSQDMEFLCKALLSARDVDVYKDPLYCYVKRPESATNAFRVSWFDGVEAMLRLLEYAKARGASKEAIKTSAVLLVYTCVMLPVRAVNRSRIRPRELRRQVDRAYPNQAKRVARAVKPTLAPLSKERLALALYRACPAAFIALARAAYKDVFV